MNCPWCGELVDAGTETCPSCQSPLIPERLQASMAPVVPWGTVLGFALVVTAGLLFAAAIAQAWSAQFPAEAGGSSARFKLAVVAREFGSLTLLFPMIAAVLVVPDGPFSGGNVLNGSQSTGVIRWLAGVEGGIGAALGMAEIINEFGLHGTFLRFFVGTRT